MPFISGIAALAVLSAGFDQVGLDPQLDKQYAVVKQGTDQPPVAAQASSHSNPSIGVDGQDGVNTLTVLHDKGVQGPGKPGDPVIEITIPRASVSDIALPGQGAVARSASGFAFTQGSLKSLKGMDRKVSVHFNDASASDVLAWLGKQNVNFVASSESLPKSRITMNLSGVPLSEALESVAEALGGNWQVKGSTLIFRHGMSLFTPGQNFSYAMPGDMFGRNGFKAFGDLKGIEPKVFNFDGKSLKSLPGMDGKAFKMDEKWLKDMKTMDGKVFELNDKMLKELQQKGKDGKPFVLDGKTLGDLKKLQGDGRALWLDDKALKDLMKQKGADGKMLWLDEKSMKDLMDKNGKIMGDMKARGLFEKDFFKGFTFKKVDAGKFLKSLSPGQKELMKKQGFLKISDLTDEQRGMIFDNPKGEMPKDFTMKFNVDGESVTIKN